MQNKKFSRGNAAILAPMYLFTVVFLIGPFVYMIVLSFLTRAETWGIVNTFTLRNYQKILEPIYLRSFGESIRLALYVTILVALIGYPFGYFMAKLPAKARGTMLLAVMIPFYTSSLMRLYGWLIIFRANGLFDRLLMALRLTDAPLKLLYTYPAVVVGMVYALLPFMMPRHIVALLQMKQVRQVIVSAPLPVINVQKVTLLRDRHRIRHAVIVKPD